MGTGITQHCCHANNIEEEKKVRHEKYGGENEMLYQDLKKINEANQYLKFTGDQRGGKKVIYQNLKTNIKPYSGLVNRNSNFINVNIQILSKISFLKDFLNAIHKTQKRLNPFFESFVNIVNSMTEGTALDDFYKQFISIVEDDIDLSNKTNKPVDFHIYFLEKLSDFIYSNELVFKEFKVEDSEFDSKSLDFLKYEMINDFASNEIKLRFFTGFFSIETQNCKNLKCSEKSQKIYSTVLPIIDVKISNNNENSQEEIQRKLDEICFDSDEEGQCIKCLKQHKRFKNTSKFLVNFPKYLLILIDQEELVSLNYNLNKKVVFFSKTYELFSVISKERTPKDDNTNDYNCSIFINYKWINFHDENVQTIEENILLENCYCLYYQLR